MQQFDDNLTPTALQSYFVRTLSGGSGNTYGPMLEFCPGQPVITSAGQVGDSST